MRTNAKLYVMRRGDGVLKLGHSQDPAFRKKQLGGPDLELVHETDFITHAERAERLAHKVLANKRIRGEWFKATLEQALEAIQIAIRQAQELGACVAHKENHQVQLSRETKSLMDELRKAEPDLPSRSEMLRRLIERAAAALKKRK